jgi:hypothetical protein
MLVEFLHDPQRVVTVRRANPVIAENRDVHSGFVLLLEQAVQIENRLR